MSGQADIWDLERPVTWLSGIADWRARLFRRFSWWAAVFGDGSLQPLHHGCLSSANLGRSPAADASVRFRSTKPFVFLYAAVLAGATSSPRCGGGCSIGLAGVIATRVFSWAHGRWAMQLLFGGAIVAMLLVSSTPAVAQTPAFKQQWTYCLNWGGAYSQDLAVGGCTAIIQSGQETQTDLAIALINRGNVYAAQGDNARAIADYDKAIRLNPKDADAFYNRGNAHSAQGDNARAIADYDQAIGLNPQDVDAFYNRGIAHGAQGDNARAIADYDQAIRLNPQNADAFYNRGNAYSAQGNYARAIADYDQVILLNPQDAEAFNTRCWTRALWGRQLDLALADCNSSLRIRSNDPHTLDTRGLVYLRSGAFHAALADYDAALRRDAKLISSLYGRGIARLRLAQIGEAQADIAAARAKDPNVAIMFSQFGVKP
ncbi:hypothetical protein ATE48_17390 [Candidatus Viadribacter manganicus]|uniref:Uncharacterized protein n=2 Tax=Candidatus Viadribacter manganicus TaxID=1759059 RepID=A0A1B1AM00_9PROT|nr:hypothetical protein ATE48_17390 [Candidatus Viadribacter manganicus]